MSAQVTCELAEKIVNVGQDVFATMGGSHCLLCVLTEPILAPLVGASSFNPHDQVMSKAVYYLHFMKAL